MPIESDGVDDTDSNDGPHCRNCHTGASNCNVCHSGGAYTATITAPVANLTSYASQTWFKSSASVAINGQCLDGGFSFPHRTLGANMLKDELYGIDFQGNPVAAGATRTANGGFIVDADGAGTGSTAPGWNFGLWATEDKNAASIIPAVRTDVGGLGGQTAENLDSVCIDCHGDASYWNGDKASFISTPSPFVTSTVDAYGYGPSYGFDLLLKGLP
ncbi:MAG: hypothetical protein CVT67_01590 [Actinobacteria bacterium HGW-Actinobacteria-7]|jgi:hypothetical protein|nr:MAG: hypothetical protein CVT67_01590 [Actinobacteria bacterium HGW-Actinobacteria-7]